MRYSVAILLAWVLIVPETVRAAGQFESWLSCYGGVEQVARAARGVYFEYDRKPTGFGSFLKAATIGDTANLVVLPSMNSSRRGFYVIHADGFYFQEIKKLPPRGASLHHVFRMALPGHAKGQQLYIDYADAQGLDGEEDTLRLIDIATEFKFTWDRSAFRGTVSPPDALSPAAVAEFEADLIRMIDTIPEVVDNKTGKRKIEFQKDALEQIEHCRKHLKHADDAKILRALGVAEQAIRPSGAGSSAAKVGVSTGIAR